VSVQKKIELYDSELQRHQFFKVFVVSSHGIHLFPVCMDGISRGTASLYITPHQSGRFSRTADKVLWQLPALANRRLVGTLN
jgi:hypothetical protein